MVSTSTAWQSERWYADDLSPDKQTTNNMLAPRQRVCHDIHHNASAANFLCKAPMLARL
jgi:hypothetical protein